MTFSENILPAIAAVIFNGFLLRECARLILLPSIAPMQTSTPQENEVRLERPKIPILPPDLSRMLEKAVKAGATNEDLDTALRNVLAAQRINNRPEANKPKLEIIEDNE